MAPGITTKVNIPKLMTSMKSSASAAVRTASRADSFSRPSSTGALGGGIRYGIGAERSKVGTGQHLNARAFYNNDNTSALRDMNSRAFFSVDSYGPYMMPTHNCNDNNKMSGLEKALLWTTVGLGVAGTTVGIINAFKSSDSNSVTGNSIKSGSLADSDIPDTNTKQTNAPASLTAMKGANDSTTLSAAITGAKAEQAAIPGKLNTANSEFATLKGNTDSLKTASETAENAYQTNLKDIETTSNQVNTLTNSVTALEQTIKSLKTQIQSSLTPEGVPGPNTVALQEQLGREEVKFEQQKQQLETTNKNLENLRAQTENLKTEATTAKDNYNTNQESIKTKESEIESLEQNKKDLDAEIPKQEKRLQELEKKDDSELSGIGKNITKLSGEIKKLKNKEKADAKQTELDRLRQRQAELQKRQWIRNLVPESNTGGTQFKSGRMPDGTMAYFVGGKEVTAEDYKNQLEQARKTQNS